MFSTTKQDQVVYQGPVRSEEEVKKDLDSIGPEIVQTLSVSTYASKASQVSRCDEVTIFRIVKVDVRFCLCF